MQPSYQPYVLPFSTSSPTLMLTFERLQREVWAASSIIPLCVLP